MGQRRLPVGALPQKKKAALRVGRGAAFYGVAMLQNVSLPEICNWRGPQIKLLVDVGARYGVEV